MSTADRSIALLDLALRRRFTFMELMPDSTLLKEKIGDMDLQAPLDRLKGRMCGLNFFFPNDRVAHMSRTMMCPGCGLNLLSAEEQLDERYNASYACRQLYGELSAYTLSLQDGDFIHQFAVDTYTAQHAGAFVKPIAITFALVGLYLAFEHNYTGRQIQKAHMLLARTAKKWPQFRLPEEKASLTVLDVLTTPEHERSDMLREWGKAVWRIWESEHTKVAEFVHARLNV